MSNNLINIAPSAQNIGKTSLSSNNPTHIDIEFLPKKKHRKILKVKAYCGQCYQFFHNGPSSKVCKAHLNKICNIVSCQKKNAYSTTNECIRKFSNINSANRHTHCLKKEDVALWDTHYEIRNYLGLKRENEKNERKNEDNDNTNNHFTTNNVIGLCDQIGHVNFEDEDGFELNRILNFSMNIERKDNKNKTRKVVDSLHLVDDNVFFEPEKNITNNDSIEKFFDLVQKSSNITNMTKKKLIKAFKEKGILNVRVLKMFYEKNKNCDFLIEQFKGITTQIEGVSLCIEYLLK